MPVKWATALLAGQVVLLLCSTLLLWRLAIHLDNIDRAIEGAAVPSRVEAGSAKCREATWPDIDETCLERVDPGRW